MLRPVLALMLALGLTAPALGQTPAPPAPGSPATISMTGHGEASGEPDMATIRLGVETQAEDPGAAVERNSAAVARVIERIKASGVAPEDIQTANFSVYPVYEHQRPERSAEAPGVIGFRVSNEVVARIRDIEGIGDALAGVVDAGANRINALSFGIEDDRALRDEARRAAIEDARHAAETYAEAAGVALGRILSIEDSVRGPIPVESRTMRMEAMAADSVPIERGQNTVTATVDMVWELVPGE